MSDPEFPHPHPPYSPPKAVDRCGPDATKLFLQELNDVKNRLNAQYRAGPGGAISDWSWTDLTPADLENPQGWFGQISKFVLDLLLVFFNARQIYGLIFLARNGMMMDCTPAPHTPECPNTEKCHHTFTICGKCVRHHVLNDALFGLCAGFFGVDSVWRWLGGQFAEKALYGIGANDPPESRCVYTAAADIGVRARRQPGIEITAADLTEILKCAPAADCAPCAFESDHLVNAFTQHKWNW